jgi:hypothetical protein
MQTSQGTDHDTERFSSPAVNGRVEVTMLKRIFVIWATLLVAPALVAADATPATKSSSPRRHSKKLKKGAGPKASDACTTDADCALTPFADGDCCPSLCPQRAVSKQSAEALQKFGGECAKPAKGCVVPECMPMEVTAACAAGHCVKRAASRE